MKNTLAILSLLIAVTACGDVAVMNTNRNTQGQPSLYKEGYLEGCKSGYAAAGHPAYRLTKDAKRFSSQNYYQQGWTDGNSACKSSYESNTRR